MKASSAILLAVVVATPALAQPAPGLGLGLGEVVVSASRANARFADERRPVVGLRRVADGAVMGMVVSSDTRDEAERKREIRAVLAAALERARAAGVALVSGGVQLAPVTRAGLEALEFRPGGRVDTSRVDVMARVALGSGADAATAAEKRLDAFIKAVPRSGRAVAERSGGLGLTVVDPDQYREGIVALVAQDAKRVAGAFGPDFAFSVQGVDGQVAWSQVSATEVFLYLPYRYTVVPR